MIKNKHKYAFTLAEVLITLVIIGVVAALTVPTLMANSRKTELETRLKQTYSVLNNAVTKAISVNGPISTWEKPEGNSEYFNKYFGPHLALSKPAYPYSLSDFGYKDAIKTPKGDIYMSNGYTERAMLNNGTTLLSMPFSSAEINGEEVPLAFYLLVDINGAKGRNVAGVDVFKFIFYFVGSTPIFEFDGEKTFNLDILEKYEDTGVLDLIEFSKEDLMYSCKEYGDYCGALIKRNGWQIPKDYPINI